MCGRYALTTSPEVLAALLELDYLRYHLVQRYNIAPTQIAPVARKSGGGEARELVGMQWGLIPSWAKDRSIGSRLINARGETAAEKPAFRSAFKRRRCLVPASGFFEWKKIDAGKRPQKQPFYIYRADEQPIVMAGLWESWDDPERGEALETYTVLTTEANAQLRDLHDRMPVILEPEQFSTWLDPDQHDVGTLQSLLQPAAEGVLAMHPVSTRVNSPKNDDSTVLRNIEHEAPTDGSGDRGTLFN